MEADFSRQRRTEKPKY